MKSVLPMLAAVLAVAGCDQEPKTSPLCDDPGFITGSRPATSASFDIDCTFDTGGTDDAPGVGRLRDCKALSMGVTYSDGTVRTHALSSASTYAASTYEPGEQASTQFVIVLSANGEPFADGWVPTLFIDVPVSLAQSGTVAIGHAALNDGCWEKSTCVGLNVAATKGESSTYSLGMTDSGQLTIDTLGLGNGSQVKLHATGVKLQAWPDDDTQALCADGKIHHKP